MKTNQHPALKDVELTEDRIAELKGIFGKLYKVPIEEYEFVIRPIYPEEWNVIRKIIDANPGMAMEELNEKITNIGLVGPVPDAAMGAWTTLPAGLPTTLAMWIRAKSGFMVPELDSAMPIITPIGGITKPTKPEDKEIEDIKSKCPFAIKQLAFEDDIFVIRPITRQEWRTIVQDAQAGDATIRDEGVCKRCVLWPKAINWDKKPAGYCETVANYILSISGYNLTSEVTEL
jgi:hypothetical protein